MVMCIESRLALQLKLDPVVDGNSSTREVGSDRGVLGFLMMCVDMDCLLSQGAVAVKEYS